VTAGDELEILLAPSGVIPVMTTLSLDPLLTLLGLPFHPDKTGQYFTEIRADLSNVISGFDIASTFSSKSRL
jgi:hypothetical protein